MVMENIMQEKEKWDARYAVDALQRKAAVLLRENLHLLAGGKALDVAMGTGHNAVFLAQHGFDVEGVDISPVAVSRAQKYAEENGVSIRAVAADLATYPIPEQSFDLI